jgi:hypothetical protein
MKERSLYGWVLMNALGLGVGFGAYLQTSWIFDHGLDWSKHWTETPPQENNLFLAVLRVPTILLIAGVILGSAQTMAMRNLPIRKLHWIFATILGFMALAFVIMPLDWAGIMGNIPGPVEPIIVTVGGCSLAGISQYLLLRRNSIRAARWLGLWIGGLFISIIPTALMFLLLSRVFEGHPGTEHFFKFWESFPKTCLSPHHEL